jgi:hypothetical protein
MVKAATTVTPLVALNPVVERWIGFALAGAVVACGILLLIRQRLQARKEEQQPIEGGIPVGGFRWRSPVALLMALVGVAIVLGLAIDERRHPRIFIALWGAILCLVAIMIVMAAIDLAAIRRRAFREKVRLLKESQRQLEAELKDYYRHKARQGNGQPKGEKPAPQGPIDETSPP